MDLGNGLGHLTYSTLVHPGDTWEDMWASLTTYVPQVKARVAPNEPFGVSLRLSADSARTLVGSPQEREQPRGFLADNDLYLYTVNAFPYGPFKGRIVKEQVYEPDWRSEERTEYTIAVADTFFGGEAPEPTVAGSESHADAAASSDSKATKERANLMSSSPDAVSWVRKMRRSTGRPLWPEVHLPAAMGVLPGGEVHESRFLGYRRISRRSLTESGRSITYCASPESGETALDRQPWRGDG